MQVISRLADSARTSSKVWTLLKLAGRNKQGVDARAAADLEAATKDFADMFWATKQ